MRELTNDELNEVSGGNIPAYLAGASFAWEIGTATGRSINRFNQRFSGVSLGAAIFYLSR